MTVAAQEEKPTKVFSQNGIALYLINTPKFKTNTINVFFHDKLDGSRATLNALLPAVLRRGTKTLPTLQDIALYLDELYGAVFDCGVVKKGERQIVQFYMEYVSDKYTGQNIKLFENAFGLLYDLITAPAIKNGIFREDYTEQEKENLRRLIEGRINDKMQYAIERCFEEMCKNEPFGVYEYGRIEDLEQITPDILYKHYENFIGQLPVDIFLTGTFAQYEINHVIDRFKELKRDNIKIISGDVVYKKPDQVRNVTEKLDVNQSKLTLGYRTNTAANDRDYYALLVYNSILGGGIQSKLFQNVREKAGLAYYIFSRLEKFKGLMVVSCGIDGKNKEKTIDIIKSQIEEINSGNISDYELNSTIKYIENEIRSLKDNPLQMVDFYLSQVVSGSYDGFEDLIDKVKKITKNDVLRVGGKINLDMVYFLTTKD